MFFGTWSATFLFVNSQLAPSRPRALRAGAVWCGGQCPAHGAGRPRTTRGQGTFRPLWKGITVPSHRVRAPGLASTSRAPGLDFSVCKTGTMTPMTRVSLAGRPPGQGPHGDAWEGTGHREHHVTIVPPKHFSTSPVQDPVKGTWFRNGVRADAIKLRWGRTGVGWP